MTRKTLINGGVFITAIISACFVLTSDSYGKRLAFNGGEVFYTKATSEAEATRLGESLTELEYFDGAEKSVQLDKAAGKLIVRFCVQEGAAEDPEIQNAFRTIQSYLSTYVFEQQPVEFQLCNEYFKPVKILEARPETSVDSE